MRKHDYYRTPRGPRKHTASWGRFWQEMARDCSLALAMIAMGLLAAILGLAWFGFYLGAVTSHP